MKRFRSLICAGMLIPAILVVNPLTVEPGAKMAAENGTLEG
jgi:hypothetical protein